MYTLNIHCTTAVRASLATLGGRCVAFQHILVALLSRPQFRFVCRFTRMHDRARNKAFPGIITHMMYALCMYSIMYECMYAYAPTCDAVLWSVERAKSCTGVLSVLQFTRVRLPGACNLKIIENFSHNESHIDILCYDLIQKSLRKYSQLILLVTLIIIFWPQKRVYRLINMRFTLCLHNFVYLSSFAYS